MSKPYLRIGTQNVNPYSAGWLDAQAVPVFHLRNIEERGEAKTKKVFGTEVALAESALANEATSRQKIDNGTYFLAQNIRGSGRKVFATGDQAGAIAKSADYVLNNTIGNFWPVLDVIGGAKDAVQASIWGALAGREEMSAARAVYFGTTWSQ